MSYCVNCGVELDNSAKKCALCTTPAVNPNRSAVEGEAVPPYPDNLMIPQGVRRKYIAFIISMVILIPNIVCVLVNLLVPQSGVWSVYVVASSAVVWLFFIFPFFLRNNHPYLLMSVDVVALSLYIYVFYAMYKQEGWFLRLALPLLALFFVMCMFMIWWLSKKRDGVYVSIAVLTQVAVFSIYTDFLVNRFYVTGHVITFSVVIAASCLALIGFAVTVAKNKRFRAWLSRKFFV